MNIQISALLISVAVCVISVAKAGPPPSTDHSREIITLATPILKTDLDKKNLRFGAPIFLRIFKESRELELWIESGDRFELFRIYEICNHSRYVGPKLKARDARSPEGFYFVNSRRMLPSSKFHLALNLGYPNSYDRVNNRTGSTQTIRGGCSSNGSYAMTNPAIEEIYTLVDAALRGDQPFIRVHIFPFPMTEPKMQRYRYSKWLGFWESLKEGYDIFERERKPPNVEVQKGKYVFESQ